MKDYAAMTHEQLAAEGDQIATLMDGVRSRQNWERLAELEAEREALNAAARAKNAIEQNKISFTVNL